MFVGYAGLISRNVTSFAAGRIAFAATCKFVVRVLRFGNFLHALGSKV